jgi:uncharacterized membrane protein (UPF0127 family)
MRISPVSHLYKTAALIMTAAAWFAAGCSSSDITDELNLTQVTFPNGVKINAETMRSEVELMRGLMFRESLPPGRGMLFIHPKENTFHYWMYQTNIPLDMIWMDYDRRIVEMSLDTPPCRSTSATDCPNYGGNFKSKYVLEVNAGVARKNGLKTGDTLSF